MDRESILEAGVALLRDDPQSWSVRAVARQLGTSHQRLNYWFKTRGELFNACAALATERADSRVMDYLRGIGWCG